MRAKTKTRKITAWKIHPGEILREEFLRPMDMSAYELAKQIRVPAPRVNDIVLEKRGITADTALRLARFFCTSVEFWMNLQAAYEIRAAHSRLSTELREIRPRKSGRAA